MTKEGRDDDTDAGPYIQISRLGNPLVNEVLIPMATKDFWNRQQPAQDSQFASHYTNPELAQLLPALYTPNGEPRCFRTWPPTTPVRRIGPIWWPSC